MAKFLSLCEPNWWQSKRLLKVTGICGKQSSTALTQNKAQFAAFQHPTIYLSIVHRMLTLLVVFVALDRSADMSLSRALQQRLSHIGCHHSLSLGAEVRVAAQHKVISLAGH